MSEYLDKQFKEKYIGFQREYLNELKLLSLHLKDPNIKQQPQGQDKLLHSKLSGLNNWIDMVVRPFQEQAQTEESVAKFKGGIVFPFD
jgi:hypothetical protein